MAWERLGSANRLLRRQAPPWPLATFCVSLPHFVLDSCVTSYYQHGGLEQWNLFSLFSRGRKAKVRVSAELCFYWELVGENPSLSLSASGAFLGLWLHYSNLYIGILQRNETGGMCVYTHTDTHTHICEGGRWRFISRNCLCDCRGRQSPRSASVAWRPKKELILKLERSLHRMHSSLGETFIIFVKTSPDWVRPTHTMMGH